MAQSKIREEMNVLEAEAKEKINNGDPVVFDSLLLGDAPAQGDVAIHNIGSIPAGAVLDKNGSAQLAPGSNRGSRHIIQDITGITFYTIEDGNELSNRCLEAKQPWTLTHPEHANYTFPAGCYRVRHQQNEAFERVRD